MCTVFSGFVPSSLSSTYIHVYVSVRYVEGMVVWINKLAVEAYYVPLLPLPA